jgi:hypothetical protein
MNYSVTQLDGGFSITMNGRTETFTEKFKLGSSATRTWANLDRDKEGKLQFAGRGYSLLAELGFLQFDKRGRIIGEPPTVDGILASATAPPVAVAAPLAKAAAPVVPMPRAAAEAILAEANAKMAALKPAASAARGAAAASMNEPDPPEVVAARVNGQRPSAQTEAITGGHGWDTIIDKINAETRSRKGQSNV